MVAKNWPDRIGAPEVRQRRPVTRTVRLWYPEAMTKLEDIAKAISNLAPAELARFREWFDTFDAARFDDRIERDAASGKLDKLADQSLEDLRDGRVREL